MAATILDISDASIVFPEFLILDASVILELHSSAASNDVRHSLAIAFLNRLKVSARQGIVKPLLPFLAFEECYFKICQYILTGYAKMAGMRWHEYYKHNPTVIQKSVHPVLVQLHQTLQAFPVDIVEPEDLAVQPKGKAHPLAFRRGELMDRFSVLPKDASILSEAERLGVYTAATLDSDWTRADGFTVFAPIQVGG
jgi:hypothetical protein